MLLRRVAARPRCLAASSLSRYNSTWSGGNYWGEDMGKKKFIILGAKSSKLLPSSNRRRRTESNRAKKRRNEGYYDELDNDREKLMAKSSGTVKAAVDESIESMRPMLKDLSKTRHDQLNKTLSRSFTNEQLKNYLMHQKLALPGRRVKQALVDQIMGKVWGVNIVSQEGSDVIVENTIDLSKRQLVLLLSRNGSILREWSKSGANVTVNAAKQAIIIRSTQETYDWITASLHQLSDRIIKRTIKLDLESLAGAGYELPVERIRQLSNAYIEYHPETHTCTISALQENDVVFAERLIVDSTGFNPSRHDEYLLDNTPALKDQTGWVRFVDDDSVNWKDRGGLSWSRYQVAQTKDAATKRILSAVPDASSKPALTERVLNHELVPENVLCSTLANRINDQIDTRPGGSTTLSISAFFGYLLKDKRGQHTFATNIPRVVENCWALPYYEMDTGVDEADLSSNPAAEPQSFEEEEHAEPSTSPSAAADELWKRLAQDAEKRRQHVYKTRQVADLCSYAVQLKFVPSPADMDPATARSLPAAEMWMELNASERADMATCQLMRVGREHNTTVQLPDGASDVRFTVAQGMHLDVEDSNVQRFLRRCKLDFTGREPIHVPLFLTLPIDGKDVQYMYQGMYHHQQVEYRYDGHLLQLSTIEGGGVGGRRVEAQLVRDFQDVAEFDPETDTKKLVAAALKFQHLLQS